MLRFLADTQSRIESYTEKVVTHKEREEFEFNRCWETSPPDIRLDKALATRVSCRVCVAVVISDAIISLPSLGGIVVSIVSSCKGDPGSVKGNV